MGTLHLAGCASSKGRDGSSDGNRDGTDRGSGVAAPHGWVAILDKVAARLEEANLAAYVDLYRRPWRMLGLNFAAGLARGFGAAVGFTLLGAVVLYLLRDSFLTNLPLIGHFVADVVRIVQRELATPRAPGP